MEYILIAIKAIIALSILNVWLFRVGQPTVWRGGDASSMQEEFEAYGLPNWMMYVVGGLKVLLSLVLLASLYYEGLAAPAASGIALLMLGAIGMHFKIGDSLKKSLPAFIFLVLALSIVVI